MVNLMDNLFQIIKNIQPPYIICGTGVLTEIHYIFRKQIEVNTNLKEYFL